MEKFELRKTANELLGDLKTAAKNQSIIKLSIDIQLPDRFVGSPEVFLGCIRETASYLGEVLINGIVNIEMSLRGVHGNVVAIRTRVTGLGSSRTEQEKTPQLNNLLSNARFKTIYSETADEIKFEFSHTLQVIDSPQVKTRLPFEGRRVLIAEDNEINAMVFTSFLEEWGVDTKVALNGADAIIQLHDGVVFDAVLMDIHMPVLNGNDATRRIREFNPNIPVIALTASTREEDIREAYLAGVNDYLLKPVSSTNLFQLLSRYL